MSIIEFPAWSSHCRRKKLGQRKDMHFAGANGERDKVQRGYSTRLPEFNSDRFELGSADDFPPAL